MRQKYDWYIRPSPDEIREIWSNGILAVDANVLLDLYRYNASTRESLIWSLEQFRGRVWMSKQAADEFVRNRHKVIVSASKSFETAKSELGSLRQSLDTVVSSLKGNRIVSQEVTDTLQGAVRDAVDEATAKVDQAKLEHPDFLTEDPIFGRLLDLFDGAIGDGIPEEKRDYEIEEAKRRIENEVPPGYLDDNKDDSRQYGDYFIWKEILDAAKQKKAPVVFVTSETKSDWWEVHSGQTMGPRPEMLNEFMRYTGQRILIYKTERFLTHAAEATGRQVDESAVEDIIAVSAKREVSGPAIEKLEQNVHEASEYVNRGTIQVRLLRPVYNFTCSGQLEPHMAESPSVYVELSQAPEKTPAYKIGAGTGTDFDFNAHIKSAEYGVALPVGTYLFEYSAAPASEERQEHGEAES